MRFPGTTSVWNGEFVRHDFPIGGKLVSVILPPRPLEGNYWAWKGEFLDYFQDVEIALLRRGFYVVYMRFPDQFGSPAAVAAWNELYACLTGGHGFAKKVALIGLSRGGLYCYQWAAANPEKVACIYGDAPVCDMRSWPGGKGKGRGSPEDWRKMMDAFSFSSEAEAMAFDGQPIDRLAPLAAARVPLLHVYGDADTAVPWDENTGVLAERYRRLGGSIELIAKPGVGHHPHGLPDPTPVVDFILTHTGAAGASRVAGPGQGDL